jgi:glucose/arabinose dehydrogenase
MGFGPDGYLYISQGDGGGGDDQHGSPGNGQSRSTYLGKILRLDVDAGDPYGIPDGNPFKGSDTFKGEIWAFGLRNPWRCGFDRLTGDLWIGDVGQNTREEVDVIPAGLGGINFGWRVREGLIQNPAYPNEKTVTPARNPICDYDHSLGNAIIGGYVYRGSGVPELQGKYIFADNGSARFWTVTPNGTNSAPRQEITSVLNPSPKQINSPTAFGEDANGELYICDYDGEIYKITSDAIHLAASRAEGSSFVISFSARARQSYTLEANSNLSDSPGTWSLVTNIPPNSANSTISITNSTSAAEQYFRVRGN